MNNSPFIGPVAKGWDKLVVENRAREWRRAQPTRAIYQVRYEIRKMGAIGVFEIGVFVVDAYTIQGACDVARAEAHHGGYEVRFPVSVVRVQQ